MLAARRLQQLGLDVKVGAVRCAVPRVPLNEWCSKELQVPEHPTFRALAHGFSLELSISLPQPMVPELLVNFTIRAELQLRRHRERIRRGASVARLTPQQAASEEFIREPQLVVFVSGNSSEGCELCNVTRGMAAMLGEPLLSVSYADCSAQGEGHGGKGVGGGATGRNSPQAGTASSPNGSSFDYSAYPDGTIQFSEHESFIKASQMTSADAAWFSLDGVPLSGAGGDEDERQLLLEALLIEEEEEEKMRDAHRALLNSTWEKLTGSARRIWNLAKDGGSLERLEEELWSLGPADAQDVCDWQQPAAGSDRGLTPLLVACAHGRAEHLRMMLRRCDMRNVRNQTLLANQTLAPSGKALAYLLALQGGHTDVVSMLEPHACSYMIDHVTKGNTEAVGLLLDHACSKGSSHTDPTSTTCNRLLGLHTSCWDGSTPLIAASSLGRAPVVQLLLERGAQVDLPGADGMTAIHSAAMYCHPSIIEKLLAFGAVPSRLVEGQAAADLSQKAGIEHGSLSWDATAIAHLFHPSHLIDGLGRRVVNQPARECLRLLSVTEESAQGRMLPALQTSQTPGESLYQFVSLSAFDPQAPLAVETLKHKISAAPYLTHYSEAIFGGTPLHAAAEGCEPKIVGALLEAGASVDATNKHGMTPLMLVARAVREKSTATAHKLLEHGASVSRFSLNASACLILSGQLA